MKFNPAGLVATSVVLVLGAAILLALAAPRRPHDRWVWQCGVSIETAHGSLTASRTLSDGGERWYDDDRFDWYARDQLGSPLPMSISWYGSWGNGSWRDGRVQVYVHDDAELPSNGRLFFQRSAGVGREAPFAVAMSSSVGNRRVASAGFRLNDLLAYARDSQTLDWTYENPMTQRKADKSGSIDIAPFADALNARRVAEQKLTAMQADYRNACRRVQDYSPRIVI